jgi:hypothetical protein
MCQVVVVLTANEYGRPPVVGVRVEVHVVRDDMRVYQALDLGVILRHVRDADRAINEPGAYVFLVGLAAATVTIALHRVPPDALSIV